MILIDKLRRRYFDYFSCNQKRALAPSNKYQQLDDQALLELYLKTSETEVIGQFYARYGHLVLGLCLKYLKNRDEAQDAVIEIFTGLIEGLKKYEVRYFKSWLYVYSKNHCLMQLSKRQSALKRELELQENSLLLMDFNDASHLDEKEKEITALQHALSELGDDQRECLELFYYKQMSYQEICDQTGLSANEVKSRIQNGKRNLKIKLEKRRNEQEAQ